MKIATGIIGLVLMMIIGMESCGMLVSSSLGTNTNGGIGGLIGMIVFVAYLVGSAFAFAKPLVATIFFWIATLLAWLGGETTPFKGLLVWTFVAFLLGCMSLLTLLLERKKKKSKPSEPDNVISSL